MDNSKIKAGLIIFGILAIFFLLIALFASSASGKNDKTSFPDYNDITVKEKDVEDKNSSSYEEIKTRIESDYYFAREALISNYNYKNYTSVDLQQMVWNYIFAYELKNRRYLSTFNQNEGLFCMRSRYVIDSFEELYGVNITKDIDYLDGYYEYVKSRNNRYCFNFGNVAKDYNNEIKVLVDGISVKDDVVTTNIYLFEYYTSETALELQYVENLKVAIKSSNSIEATNIVKNKLNGKVTHKQLEFKINNGGKFFKYQILNSKNLSY